MNFLENKATNRKIVLRHDALRLRERLRATLLGYSLNKLTAPKMEMSCVTEGHTFTGVSQSKQ